MTEDETIALAVTCNLGRTMTPLGRNTGEVFATDQSYRTAELFAFADAVRSAEREACAKLAESINDGCMGAPDGPEEIATAIRLRSNAVVSGAAGIQSTES